MIWQISVAIIALAFFVLVIYLIQTLKAARISLDKTSQTLQEVRQTIDELSYEVKQVIRNVSDITDDLEHKLKKLDPVMESVKNVGSVLSEVTLATRQVSSTLIDRIKKPGKEPQKNVQIEQSSKDSGKWLKVVDIGADLWKRYRS